MDEIKAVFSEKLKNLMTKTNVKTQSRFALYAGLDHSEASLMLAGKRLPSLVTLVEICNALNTTPNYLLGFDYNGVEEQNAVLKTRIAFAMEMLKTA